MSHPKIDYSDNSVISITKENLEEAIKVLTRAFEDDPVVRYFLSGHEKDYPEGDRKLFGYQCLMYIEMGLPIFGTVRNNHITGVACLSGPEKKDRPDSLIKADREFVSFMGPDSLGRIKRYMNLSKKHTTKGLHHYLSGLGVHPDFQGQGFGRLLLDEVYTITESHQTSTGIYLETAKMKNVEMYQHCGYNLLATEKLDGIVDLWYMFRPVKKND
jgi:ribosomal protein S18 acetylase RimI-like enzyme